jgi:hypothetical protein
LVKTYKISETFDENAKIGSIEYRFISNHQGSTNPVNSIKNSYNDLPVSKYYYGRIGTSTNTYFYIGYKIYADYSAFLIFGYDKYLHIARLFNSSWTDETIL